jgi:zinc transporter ZupT
METWEKIILAVIAGLIMFFFFPRMKHWIKDAPKGNRSDWMGLAFILGFVVLFVLLMIMSVK